MSRHHTQRSIVAALLAVAAIAGLRGQGRGGGEWTTSGFDAQRTAWLRSDPRLTKEAVTGGEFRFLWKMAIENESRQLSSLTAPVLLDRLIGYRGFKSLAFFGGSDDRVFSVDTDLARPYWMTVLNYTAATGGRPPASLDCPGGLVAMPSRRTQLAPAGAGGPGGGGRQGGVRNGSAVGAPGKGAEVLSRMQPQRGAAQAGGRAGEGRGGRQGRGGPEGRAGLAARGGGFGGVEPLFAMGSDGYLHALYVSNGADVEPPVPFLPPDAKPSALILVDGVVYTTTSGECGAVPNAVWALDLSVPTDASVPAADRRAVSWKTGGAPIAGASGLAFGTDGTIYVALGQAPSGHASSSQSDAIVALDRLTLKPKDWFTAPGADFNSTPVVIRHKEKDLVAASANDGRLYLLDAASLGGTDHRTPLAVSEKFGAPAAAPGLASFEDRGVRWILAPAADRIVAFRIGEEGGKLSLARGWQSRLLTSPLAPIVVNGMVFAVSSGEYRPPASTLSAAQRARRSVPAVLYVLDAASGKVLWSSGTTITSFARAGLSAGGGQVYVVTYDNHLYAFGIPMEH